MIATPRSEECSRKLPGGIRVSVQGIALGKMPPNGEGYIFAGIYMYTRIFSKSKNTTFQNE
jgi:hypothetical protein